MPGDIYQAQEPDAGLTPLPSAEAPTQGFQAAQQAGYWGDMLAFRLGQARNMTLMTQAKTDLLQASAPLVQKYTQDPDNNDFKTAPAAYQQEAQQTTAAILGKYSSQLPPEQQAELNHFAVAQTISGANQVNNVAFQKEASTNIANWQTQSQLLAKNYLSAGSQTERDEIQQQGMQTISGLAHSGWITPAQGAQEAAQFTSGLQESYVAKVMQTDPAAAKAMLADPDQLTGISASRRIVLQNGAQAQVDDTGQLKLSILAKTSPPAAAAAIGRIAPGDTARAAQIFDKGVAPQESGGNANAVSPAGALGVAQVMPSTARAMATQLGLKDVAGLSDPDLRARLLSDPKLNRQLGLTYFNGLVDHYGGYIPAALAAYNAGPGNADKWINAATDKFGNDPTPAQFASVVGIKETHDYIGSVYQRLGAPTDAFGLTGNAQLRGQETVLDLGRQEQTQQTRMLRDGAALARADDPVTQILQDGYAVDPVRIANYRNTQAAAAAAGDPHAAAELRRIDFAQANASVMHAAYQMTPEQLSAVVAEKQAQLAQSPNVTADQTAQLKALQTVQSAMNAAKSTNPVGLAERQGMFQPVPVLAQQINTPAFGDALAARAPQVAQAAQAYGGAIVPFKPDEASALKTAWGNMGPADKASFAATLATNFHDPQVYDAAIRQVAGDNRLDVTAGLLGARDPELAQKILTGAEMLKDKGVETKVQGVRAAITNAIPVGLYPNTQTNSDVAEAVTAVYAANKGGQHALIDPTDTAGIKSAMEEVTGPQIALNGRVTPIPKPYSPGAVQHMLANLTAEDVKPLGGLQPGLDPGWLGQHAQLMPLRLGGDTYQVLVDGKRVLTADGRNLQVNFGDFVAHQNARLKAAANAAGVQRAQSEADDGPQIVPGL